MIRQVDALLAAPIAESPILAMAPKGNVALRTHLEALESDAIRPAMTRYRDFLRGEFLAKARDTVGVAANPNGAMPALVFPKAYSTRRSR